MKSINMRVTLHRAMARFCRYYVTLVTLFAMPFAVRSQASLFGRLTDSSRQPVPSAVVTIRAISDSLLLKTSLSDSTGTFTASISDTARRYLLTISAIGYIPEMRIVGTDDCPIQFILSEEPALLAEVVIATRKRLIDRRADRTIFNVDASIATAGSDAFEMLRKAPSIQVNGSEISIAGKSTVSVMVNDRLVQLSGEELLAFLKSIPAEQLSRIEVISTPPAKYDAEGNSGLINIVTKKALSDGLNGNVSTHYAQHIHGMYGLTGMFNFRRSKWNIFGNGNSYNGYIQPTQHTTTLFSDKRMEQETYLKTQNVFNRMTIGADYALNDKMVLGILGIIGNGGWSYNADESQNTQVINLQTGTVDSTLVTKGHNTDRGFRRVLNLNWEWKIDTNGKKLNVDIETFSRIGDRTRNFTTAQYLPDEILTGPQSDNRTGGRQDVKISFVKADAVWPTKLVKLSFGGKAGVSHTISENLFSYLEAGQYRTDYGKTNTFDYREATQAAYVSAMQTFGKWEVHGGLRAEYTQTRAYSPTLSQENRNDYFQIFPTAYVQYNSSEAHAFNIAYSRRISRPSFWIMNPFRTYFTALSYTEGNPFLQPSFSNNLNLTYTLHTRYSFSLYATQQRSIFMNVTVLDTATRSYHITQANTGKTDAYGFSSELSLNAVDWWECNLEGSLYMRKFRSDFYGTAASYSTFSLYLGTDNTFTLNKSKTLIAQLNMRFNGPQQNGFDRQSAQGEVSAGIRALLLKKTITVSLNADDILKTDRWRVVNQANGTVQDNYFDERQLRLTISWKFGSTKVKPLRERSIGVD